MFVVGRIVFRKCPVTSSVEGVVGYTKLAHIVVGPSFDYKGITYVPVTRHGMGKDPFLVNSSDLYTEEKQ